MGPRQNGSVGVGRITCGQSDHAAILLAEGSQPIDGSRQRELRAAQALDEVTAADATRLLHGPQHRVQPRESAWPSLAGDALAGEDSIALEEHARRGVQPFGWVR